MTGTYLAAPRAQVAQSDVCHRPKPAKTGQGTKNLTYGEAHPDSVAGVKNEGAPTASAVGAPFIGEGQRFSKAACTDAGMRPREETV